MRGKRNSNKHCELPKNCRAKGDKLCPICCCRAMITRCHADQEFSKRNAARSSKRLKALFENPDYVVKHRKTVRANAKKLNDDPSAKKKARARMKALRADPEINARREASLAKLRATPEYKEAYRQRWAKTNRLPKVIAKRRWSMVRNGHWLIKDEHEQIAFAVATTNATYAEIGADWLITGSHVGAIAKEYGVARGRRWRDRLNPSHQQPDQKST